MSTQLITERKRGADKNRLTAQQQLFIDAILADKSFNATNAARAAGYKNAPQAANSLMKKPVIQAMLGKAFHQRRNEFKLDQVRILQELQLIALANPKEMYDEHGNLLSIHQMPDSIARCLSGFDVQITTRGQGETTETVTAVKPRFWSKLEALHLIAKHLGMLVELSKSQNDIGATPEMLNLLTHLLEKVEQQPSNVIDAKFIEDKSNVG